MERTPARVSVIVPSYNAGRWLGDQLRALTLQDYGGEHEVIVADNGSTDASRAVAGEFAGRLDGLRILDVSHRRAPGAARNAGARVATGDFLAFCDADDVVSPTWLSKLVTSAAAADLVGGSLDGGALNAPEVAACFQVIDPRAPHLGFLPTAAGTNLGVWTDVFKSLGAFDERARSAEDVEFVWRAQLQGYRFVASEALAHQRFRTDLCQTARQFFVYGLGDAWLYRRFKLAGMPRRDRKSTLELWRGLARGFSGLPKERRRRTWVFVLALSCGRLIGSVKQGVVFT